MHTILKIMAVLANLFADKLHHIEQAIHNLYRSRRECVIYDDDYGIWTEHDQILAAEEIFRLLDKAENLEQNL